MSTMTVDTTQTNGTSKSPAAFLSTGMFVFFVLGICAALYIGWRLKPLGLVTAERGVGYGLGIAGGLAFLFLLVYPLRKRLKGLRNFGSVRAWFRLHMILGILAPVLILFHSNFSLGSLNSNVALFCMLIVATSGLIGRYAYAKIHRGLYGSKVNLKDKQAFLVANAPGGEGAAELVDGILEAVRGQDLSLWQGLRRRRSLYRLASQLRRQVRATSPDRVSWRAAKTFAREAETCGDYLLYQRVFALWHFAHLPLFFMLVLAAFVHIIAVHAY